MAAARYLVDTSGLFRILQEQHRQAWADQLTSGVIATCPVVELEFLSGMAGMCPIMPRGGGRAG